MISIKLQSNFIEITLWHGCSLVDLLHIFRTRFYKLLLILQKGIFYDMRKLAMTLITVGTDPKENKPVNSDNI